MHNPFTGFRSPGYRFPYDFASDFSSPAPTGRAGDGLPAVGPSSSFLYSSVKNPDAARGIDLNYALFTDMSKWHDHNNINTNRAISCSLGSILLDHNTLVIYEGNRPNDFPKLGDDFPSYHRQLLNYFDKHITYSQTPLPRLLDEALYSSLHHSRALFIHLPL